MSPAVLEPERAGLEELETRIRNAVQSLQDELESVTSGAGIDPEYVERFSETARRLSVQLSNDLPPQLEPEAVAEIRRIIINGLDDLERIDPERPLDIVDSFFVKAEAVRHIIRDALDEQVSAVQGDAQALVEHLRVELARISQAEQARLIGMSIRHLQRLAKDGGVPPRRLALVVALVQILRYAWTPEGVVAWFYRERRALDGHAPIDVLGDIGFEAILKRLARRGRAGHGS